MRSHTTIRSARAAAAATRNCCLSSAVSVFAFAFRSGISLVHHAVFRSTRSEMSTPRPNHAMERTSDRFVSTFEMTSTLPLRATRALVRRRSSCSR